MTRCHSVHVVHASVQSRNLNRIELWPYCSVVCTYGEQMGQYSPFCLNRDCRDAKDLPFRSLVLNLIIAAVRSAMSGPARESTVAMVPMCLYCLTMSRLVIPANNTPLHSSFFPPGCARKDLSFDAHLPLGIKGSS